MRKILPVELNYCDGCGKQQDDLTGCISCGTEHCGECRDTVGKEYPHSVHRSGSGDGYYCKPCDAKLSKAGNDKRFQAYLEIEALRGELKEWASSFERKRKAAELAVLAMRART